LPAPIAPIRLFIETELWRRISMGRVRGYRR
jgi:hypothetical protein